MSAGRQTKTSARIRMTGSDKMETIKVFYVDFPSSQRGLTAYGYDENGELFYTIFLNARLNVEQQCASYWHEISHVDNHDFNEMVPLQDLEAKRHGLNLCFDV